MARPGTDPDRIHIVELPEQRRCEIRIRATLKEFDAGVIARTWLFGIAHHRCVDAIRVRKRRDARIELDPEVLVDYVDPASGPADRVDLARQVAVLEGCLGELSHDIRVIVLLRFLFDMTYEEMARLLGSNTATLQVRVRDALPLLRRCLERKGWKPE